MVTANRVPEGIFHFLKDQSFLFPRKEDEHSHLTLLRVRLRLLQGTAALSGLSLLNTECQDISVQSGVGNRLPVSA